MEILRGRPRLVELVAAGLLGVLGVGEVLVPFGSRVGSGSEVASAAAAAVVAVSLLWCRRVPWLPAVVFAVAWPLALLPTGSVFILFYGQLAPLLVVLFLTVRYGEGRVPALGAGVVVASFVAIDVFSTEMRSPGELFFHWTVGLLTASAAVGLRRLEGRARASTRRAIEAEVGAAEQAMRAVVDERTRIARELHDIVAHAVTSMVVQAGAAQQADGDRAFVDTALDAIRRTGNDALAEMRRLVGMLREESDAPLAPQPRLEALPALIAAASTEGPATRLEVVGAERELPVGLDLAVYRIVQEALTNVRKHAQASECVVRLEYHPDEVRLEVVDDGRGGSAREPGGHGLVGMRERVGMYGGRFTAGPERDRGFAVRAVLPVAT
ncbi:sensor histidine kinase [Nocardioides coralli]|uniref:sensor histidine kinase n=1 Tax=Nocardioides coralli TaxID=2872154 RepID=UPI001CA41241|nr:sensor histidine kinase [Nocardioides coralli]QZY29549.1 sensor histidine kinase [Nocardioides coralli]